MLQNKHELIRYAKRAGVAALALTLGVLILGVYGTPVASGAPNNKGKELTRVYQHTYDEVFQASQEAIERMGMYVTAKDKDKGTISGNGSMGPAGKKCTFDIHIEALNTKPETRATITATVKGVIGGWANTDFETKLSAQIQQVLSTYH